MSAFIYIYLLSIGYEISDLLHEYKNICWTEIEIKVWRKSNISEYFHSVTEYGTENTFQFLWTYSADSIEMGMN